MAIRAYGVGPVAPPIPPKDAGGLAQQRGGIAPPRLALRGHPIQPHPNGTITRVGPKFIKNQGHAATSQNIRGGLTLGNRNYK